MGENALSRAFTGFDPTPYEKGADGVIPSRRYAAMAARREAGRAISCPPHHKLPDNSRHEGSKCVAITNEIRLNPHT